MSTNSNMSMVKTAASLATANARVAELEARVGELEKRAAAEEFLIEVMDDPATPFALRPTSIDDFLEKRAMIEGIDLETARAAVKLAGAGSGFEIGTPDASTPLYESSGSQADDMFIQYLLGSSQG